MPDASSFGRRDLSVERATPYVRTNLPAPRSRGDHGPAVGAHEPRP